MKYFKKCIIFIKNKNLWYTNLACNSKCTGCINASYCTGCNGADSAQRDPTLTCNCKSTAWNNSGVCTGIINIIWNVLIKF